MMDPVNSILIKRTQTYKFDGYVNLVGEIVSADKNAMLQLNRDIIAVGSTVYYKLLKDSYYSVNDNCETYDYVKPNCIFGIQNKCD